MGKNNFGSNSNQISTDLEITSTKKRKQGVKKIILTLAAITSLLIHQEGFSQGKFPNPTIKIGVAAKTEITSDGYGTQYLPSLFIKSGRGSYLVAPTIQQINIKISGFRISYEFDLTGEDVPNNEDCKCELFVFADAAVHYNAKMGKGIKRAEEISNPQFKKEKMNEANFTSVEGYVGFGLRIPFLKSFRWTSMIGLGGYHSIDFPNNSVYYEGKNIGLLLSTGISMKIVSLTKKHKAN